ncbi:MAG: T9SS type A sorting domain-containing protein [Lewinellaceae bacterium]|nr:T9SS type A sorting domain-containing protein [Phaeodactylibacter sp.]MCB9039647.1 T9SS type A sorting domain-containing protein [Lewinellaceae bacterium]
MKYHPLPVSNTYRRFVALAGKVQRLLEQGEFQKLSAQQQQQLADKLMAFYRRLSAVFSQKRLRRILASAALLLGLGGGAAQAQQFAAPVADPFGLSFDRLPLTAFADLDNDGDQDLLTIQYSESVPNFVYYENVGTAQAPAFGNPVFNPFGLATSNSLTTSHFVDIDDDGDLDLFAGTYGYGGEYLGALMFYENEGTAESPAFAPEQTNPFGLRPSNYQMVPVFADLDNDGDFDLLGTNYDYETERIAFQYQENTGSATDPQFSGVVDGPFGLSNFNLYVIIHALADLDMDGDIDLISGGGTISGLEAVIEYFENTGSPEAPEFAAPLVNPFGISFPEEAYLTVPTLVDIDDDGDLDLFTASYYYSEPGADEVHFSFFENTAVTNSAGETAPDSGFKAYPTLTAGVLNWQLNLTRTEPQLQMQAFSVDGRQVKQWRLEGLPGLQQGQLDVGALPAGVYQLRLSGGNGQLLGQERFVVR